MDALVELNLSKSLAGLAARIRTEHEQVASATQAGLAHAIAAGNLLIEAKAMVEHGDWLQWLDEHCELSERTAQAYMRVARKMPKLASAKTQRVADLSLRQMMNVMADGPRVAAKVEAVDAAAGRDPERFGRLRDDVERTGRVDGPYRRLSNMQQAEAIRAERPSLPNKGPYRAAMVDIPWAYEPEDDDAAYRGVLPYPTISIEQACALDVASIMHEVSALGFWVTNFILVNGLHVPVLRAWRFEPKVAVTWPKDRAGRGHYAKGQTEHLIIATRGKPVVTLSNQTTLLQGPFHLVDKGQHSTKPAEAYIFFESLFPSPRYADLFSRYQHNDRWDCHGDQAPKAEAAK